MNAEQVWGNIVAYSLQIGLVAGIGAIAPALLRMRIARIRLIYWQMVLVACLALPWARSWRRQVVTGAPPVSAIMAAEPFGPVAAPPRKTIPYADIALYVLAAGAAIRLGLLIAGLLRLRSYRRRGRGLPVIPGTSGVSLLLSEDVTGPVTFGWRDPVVLLPTSFPSLPDEIRDVIICHELLHVQRRDWLFTIGEELARAALWFHPGVWWVIGEIHLAREQTVDRAVIETTRARNPYLDALLLMAGAAGATEMDLAPAPMFLRRRHLRRRLMEVMQESYMSTISKTRLVFMSGAAAALLATACWLATGAFPLTAAPQIVDDAPGVSVNLNGAELMHRAPVSYPAEALAKGVEGAVAVQVRIDAGGEVSDAEVISGPDELRKTVLQSVLTWHFDRSAASSTRTVNIDFTKPPENAQPARQLRSTQREDTAQAASAVPAPVPPRLPMTGRLERITIAGLSDSARIELLSRLPVRVGGEWSAESLAAVRAAVKEFDAHLTVGLARTGSGDLFLNIALAATGANSNPDGVYTAGNGVSPPAVLTKADPEYSEEARAAKYSGSVMLQVVVGTDGKADVIDVIRSVGMGLDEKAVEAVQKWTFRPGVLNGVPVPVRALIEVNFRLLDKPPAAGGGTGTGQAMNTSGSPGMQLLQGQRDQAGTPAAEGIYSVGNGTSPPRVLSKTDPSYSEEARAAKLSGAVTLSTVINTDGRAEDIRIVKGLGMGLDEMAVASVQQWVFSPGTHNGIPVKVRAQIEINFRLLDKE